jgi:hypothetical protein
MQEQENRACVACDEVYYGGLDCPACGEPGEPLEIEMRQDPPRDQLDYFHNDHYPANPAEY